ncbi:hypothetical protein [Plantactinospora sonchi]|uniref:Uncharacterized protein n=1 Tax=Plantactinospora sonchi TaxID=1544735 RepID=A0ABU7S3Z0_9ACTN
MAAKRKTRSGRKSAAGSKPSGRELAGKELTGSDEGTVTADSPTVDGSELPAVARPTAGRPVAPTTGPVPRGGAGFSGVGRGQGAGSARRYAFRRS